MRIEILGTGCPKCKMLEKNAIKAVTDAGVQAEIIKVTDIEKIIEYGVMSTPAIVIDGKVKAYGKIATTEEIRRWLK
ncbi:MAG: thioredoxin family protein [Nanoarchaeota archaeon]